MTEPRDGQLMAELAHWRGAVASLADLDTVAAPAAWAMLEDYLRLRLRDRLLASIRAVADEGAAIASQLDAGETPDVVRRRVLGLRSSYIQVEAIVDFYGDAINTRTNPTLGAVLGGLDTIAVDSMEVLLRPLGIEVPPALVWMDKGTGAAILRAGVRLWGPGGPSPVAAIKLTRHNLGHPTALLHETGHQVAHLTGWTDELGDALLEELSPQSPEVAELWRSWRSEIAADIHAFVLAGWAPVPALANVVDGTTPAVHRIRAGDPHPPGWLRVMLNVALCRRWFGAGPWDALAAAWQQRHDPGRHSFAGARVAAASLPLLPRVVAVCTDWPFAAFKGRPIHALADPRRVAPPELAALAQRAGPSLLASRYLARRESLRILACLTASQSAEPAVQAAAVARLHKWLATLAPNPLPRAA
ncbi:MAG TPA: hypothetical protein VKK19_12180 [Candidatus Dormibacteraeota bacterium]|nr:hypothetical protein [Candidatus Dormibacteraeota bacterium]